MIEQYRKSIEALEFRSLQLDDLYHAHQVAYSDYVCRKGLIDMELDDLYAIVNYLSGKSPVLKGELGFDIGRVSTQVCGSILL